VDRRGGQRPGGRGPVPGDQDVGQPLAPRAGRRRPVGAGLTAISAKGALRFSVLPGTLTGARFIAFLPRLISDAQRAGTGPVFCIVDNHPVHRAKTVDRFVASTHGALRLHRLPAYSPHLNPDEWV
jgi:hypothetical protein